SFARVSPGPRGCACSLAHDDDEVCPWGSWSALLLLLAVARRLRRWSIVNEGQRRHRRRRAPLPLRHAS
ncbi:MAG: MYXO-CTERM sorting domain-containing protein, partial [Minicystis sp.]